MSRGKAVEIFRAVEGMGARAGAIWHSGDVLHEYGFAIGLRWGERWAD
jgi:hypothetical protein